MKTKLIKLALIVATAMTMVFGATLVANAEESAEMPLAVFGVVEKGDTLSKIAKECYGDSSLWTYIYDCNRATIKNPNMISVGQVLVIPTIETIASAEIAKAAVAEAEMAAQVAAVEEIIYTTDPWVLALTAPKATKNEFKALDLKIKQALDIHNTVVAAVEVGAIALTEDEFDMLDAGADALNIIDGLQRSDLNGVSAYLLYEQLDNYIDCITAGIAY